MNDNNIRVSVIVPIYGIEAFLSKCIESVIHQSYNNLEIILVDDGSKDNCPAICDAYKEKDIRIRVIHKQNGGLVSARKAGLEIATGDYICHVDGDDWLHPDYIQNFITIINQYLPDIVCSGEYRAYPAKEIKSPLQEREGLYNREEIDKEILPSLLERSDGYYLNHANQLKCIKRDLAVKSLSTVSNAISMSEDHACTSVAFTNAETIYISKECLYYYRIAPESMTNSKKTLPWAYPHNLSQHFIKNVDLTRSDLKEQYYRAISHFLFNTIVSQFNSDRTYKEVCADIDNHISEFKEIVNKAQYSTFSHQLMVFTLKHNMHIVYKIYASLRYK